MQHNITIPDEFEELLNVEVIQYNKSKILHEIDITVDDLLFFWLLANLRKLKSESDDRKSSLILDKFSKSTTENQNLILTTLGIAVVSGK